MKRTPLSRYKGLETRTGLQRQARISPVSAKPRTARPQRRDERPSGEFTPAVKLLCRTRAGNGDPENALCESCGTWLGRYGGIVQHRRARMSGGSRDPVIASIVNAALQCGTSLTGCNGLAEARDAHMNGMGYWIEHGNGREYDPRYVPIMLHGTGSGIKVWLGADGEYAHEPPEVAA